MKKIYLFITIALVAFSSSEDILDKIVAGFKKYLQEFPQEKIYLHTDRPYYTNGDTIWFKAYLMGGTFHEPSQLSHTVYVELIDANGKLIKQSKLLVNNSSAASNIALPDSIASGNYLLRAYTHWMKNNDEDYFFHHLIKIWNKSVAVSSTVVHEKKLDVQFFPEGGDLVNGLVSRVAFKAIGADGLSQEVKGKIIDELNATICEFKSNMLGMGAFYFTPRKNKNYRAVIENYSTEIKLPQVKVSGLVMSLRNTSQAKDIIVRMQTSDSTNLNTIYIVAQTRGVVCFTAHASIATHSALVKIPKEKFLAGISQITITDANGTPLAERLAFIEEKPLSVKISTDKKVYAPRELVNLQIEVTDTAHAPVKADLSLAVCDDELVPLDNNRESINSYLLLSSELKGYVQSPGYYFNPANADRETALDFLLLTQGWRRFAFKQTLEQQSQNLPYKIENGLTIKGKLVDKYNNKPIDDGKVIYMTYTPATDIRITRTNASGDFELNNIVYFDSAHAVLQGETKKGKKWVKFLIDSVADFQATHFQFPPIESRSEFEKSFFDRSIERKKIDLEFDKKIVLLKEVEVIAHKDAPESTNKMYGSGTVSFQVEGNTIMESMIHPLQLIQGKVAGVIVSGGGQDWSVTMPGTGSSMPGNTQPLIMVDNVFMDIQMLNSISVRDIASVEVWKGTDVAVFGSRGAGGVIGFYTKRGARFNPPQGDGVMAYYKKGFEHEREFYVPKYDVQKPIDTKPDKRITLFWAPHIKTDSTGHASISFYNHDEETKVNGIIEGISLTGKPVVTTFEYEIKKN